VAICLHLPSSNRIRKMEFFGILNSGGNIVPLLSHWRSTQRRRLFILSGAGTTPGQPPRLRVSVEVQTVVILLQHAEVTKLRFTVLPYCFRKINHVARRIHRFAQPVEYARRNGEPCWVRTNDLLIKSPSIFVDCIGYFRSGCSIYLLSYQ
jgi:hypothetical protein